MPNFINNIYPVGGKFYGKDSSGSPGFFGSPVAGNRAAAENTIALLGNSVVAQNTVLPTGTVLWTPSTSVSLGTKVQPRNQLAGGIKNSVAFECTSAGTTAATYSLEPTWPTTLGDTVVDGGVTWTAVVAGDVYQSDGWWFLAQSLSGQRLQEVFISGLSGAKVASIAERLPAALLQSPGYVSLIASLENDVWSGGAPTASDISDAWDTFEQMVKDIITAGSIPIISTLLPSGHIDAASLFTGYSAAIGTKAWNWLNSKTRALADTLRNSVIFIDISALYLDPNPANPVWPENTATYLSSSGSGQALKKTDGIHPQYAARWLIAQAVASAIRQYVPDVNLFSGGAGNIYTADPNPLNYGIAGTKGTGVTGDVPNSLTMNAYGTGAAATASVVARDDGVSGNVARAVYTATSGDNLDLSFSAISISSLGLSVGDVVQAVAEITVDANPTLLPKMELRLRFLGATNPQWVITGGAATPPEQDLGQFITAKAKFTLKTPRLAIPAGCTSIALFCKVYGRGASNFTIDYGRRALNRVSIPEFS